MIIRMLKQSDMLKCPHCIMVPEHYRDDGSCKCNDPSATIMLEWGYVWSYEKQQWVSPPETLDD